MLILCTECKIEISDKAEKCPKCGAPAPDWTDKHPVIAVVVGFSIIGVIAYGLIWNIFLKSEIEIFDEKINYSLTSDREISFTAKNSGPRHVYNFHVLAGDEVLDRFFSKKYCKGTFVMERDEEKQIKIGCPDLNFTFTKYSISIRR
jgi:hypothetical protein